MIAFLTSLFAALPVVGNIVTSLTAAFYNAKVQLTTAKIGGDVAVARAIVTAEVQNNQTKVSWLATVAGSPVLAFVVCGFAFPFIFYLNKVVVWDICLGLGETPVLKYELLDRYGSLILSGIFVTSSASGIAHAFLNRKD